MAVIPVLALRAAGLGDLLTAVPALRSLSAFAPRGMFDAGSGVSVATPAWLHPVVDLIPGVERAVPVAGLAPVIEDRPVLAANLHGCGPESHKALLATQPQQLLAFRLPGVWRDGPQWRDDEPERERWCRLLDWIGLSADPEQVGIERPAVEPEVPGAVVLHLGASDRARAWPVQRFAELASQLADVPVVLTGTAADRGAARELAKARSHCTNLVAQLSLTQLAAQVAAAQLVVSADTGVAHLAVAYGVPSVVIFGPASVRRWGPPDHPRHRVLQGTGESPEAADVGVAAVVEQVRDLLEVRVA
jgi:ADP-heptose:LPS heptosyltransferase